MKAPVTGVKFSRGRISFGFFGHKIRDKILLKKEEHVADWSRKRREVFVDKGFGKKEMENSFSALALHEAVEKFCAEKFHLNVDEEAHSIARKKEKEFVKKSGGNWRSHELIVYWDWHKQGEH